MRIESIRVKDHSTLSNLEINELSDVVIIAGPNGVGKTRLMNAMTMHLRKPQSSLGISMKIKATCETELNSWQKDTLDTSIRSEAERLYQTLQLNQRRSQYKMTVLNFDSDRSISNINALPFAWNMPDPLLELVGSDSTFGDFRGRFPDVQHSLFRILHHHNDELAKRAKELKASGASQMDLSFPDPLAVYKKYFYELLAPKELIDPDLPRQRLMYKFGGEEYSFDSLSSGEREVANVLFDFILRNPSDSVVLFDEPELHLHPELSYRFIRTLSSVGSNNQFIFCTHSAEMISASLDNTVVFIRHGNDKDNHALVAGRGDEGLDTLRLLGQSIGVIALGKRVVLIEGNESSTDKQVYGAILKSKFPEFVLVPTGDKHAIISFDRIRRNVLEKTLWGVSFFMIVDGDTKVRQDDLELSELPTQFATLPKYHIENYFLDENIIAKMLEDIVEPSSWLRSSNAVGEKLRQIARGLVGYAVALRVAAKVRNVAGNVDVMPSGAHNFETAQQIAVGISERAREQATRLQECLEPVVLQSLVDTEFSVLSDCFAGVGEDRKNFIPGKPILRIFAKKYAGLNEGYFKRLYIRAVERNGASTFSDIEGIFQNFRACG